MLDDNNSSIGHRQMPQANASAGLIVRQPDLSGSAAKPARKRVVRDAGSSEARPVRLGRVPDPAGAAQQALPLSTTSRHLAPPAEPAEPLMSVGPAAPLASMGAPAVIDSRWSEGVEIVKALADLHAKFDEVKESFTVLEAHVSIGLGKSIAGMIRGEVAVLEEQMKTRYRYRTRYRLALAAAFAIAAMVVVDRSYPFIDRTFAILGL